MKPAAIIIDMQQHFFDEKPSLLQTELIQKTVRFLSVMRELKVPIIHVITLYKSDKSNWPAAWKNQDSIWCLEGTSGAEILVELRPEKDEAVVHKTRFSAFYDTELEKALACTKADTLLIAGYSCDVCVRFTVMDAYNRGYRVVLLSDCVESMAEDTPQSIEYLRMLANIETVTVQDIHSLVPIKAAGAA